jgi:thiamine kinase-like enzyme
MADLTGILRRIEERLGPREGEPVPLDGGITNRNFRVAFAGRDHVVRLPGKDTALLGINRDSERLAAAEAARLGIGPELAYADEDCAVTVFVDASPADAARLGADPRPAAHALRAFHDSGLDLPTRFWVPDLLDEYARVVAERGGTLPDAYGEAQELVARIARVLPLDEPVPCHDDLLAGNILCGPAGEVLLVDWEYAGMGHRLFDLANLAVNNELGEAAEGHLLNAYFGTPVRPDRRAALTLMKLVSDAREAAWGVVQGVVSDLDFDFAGYARKHFDRLAAAATDARLEEWIDAAAA